LLAEHKLGNAFSAFSKLTVLCTAAGPKFILAYQQGSEVLNMHCRIVYWIHCSNEQQGKVCVARYIEHVARYIEHVARYIEHVARYIEHVARYIEQSAIKRAVLWNTMAVQNQSCETRRQIQYAMRRSIITTAPTSRWNSQCSCAGQQL